MTVPSECIARNLIAGYYLASEIITGSVKLDKQCGGRDVRNGRRFG
jgi:hypothetical protein